MARYGQQTLSKRAQHKADVEARKDQPFVKRRKQRRNPLPFPFGFFAMARENEREGVLMTIVQKRPLSYMLEHVDANGVKVQGVLRKASKSHKVRGWHLLVEGGNRKDFRTQRRALKFFSRLQKVEERPPIKDEDNEEGT